MQTRTKNNRQQGYTLVEVMIAASISAILVGGALSMFIGGLNFASYNTGKLLVNNDIRGFTSELADNATYANDFTIYQSYEERTILNDGKSGDFLLLSFRDPNAPSKTVRLVGYYRSAAPGKEGPVRKFDLAIDPPSEADTHSLLPEIDQRDAFPEVVELSLGLSDGRLFYNFSDRSVMVRGEILHQGSTTRRATNTYNFTISPRG